MFIINLTKMPKDTKGSMNLTWKKKKKEFFKRQIELEEMRNKTSNEKCNVWDSQKIRHCRGKTSELEKENNGNYTK